MSDKRLVCIHLLVATIVSAIAILACSKIVAISLISAICVIEAINIFGVFYAVKKLPSHPKFIETASNQRLTELLLQIYLVATHLLDNDVVRRYPSLESNPKEMNDAYCMAALLRLFLFKLELRGNATRALSIITSCAQMLFPTQKLLVDSVVEYQNETFPGGAFGDLSRRKFGGNQLLCMTSFVSLWLADSLSGSEQEAPALAKLLSAKMRQFIEHI